MLSWIFFLLAVRSSILAWQKKSFLLRFFDLTLGILSFALFLLLPREFYWPSFVIIAALMAFFLYRRFSKSPQGNTFSFKSVIGWGFLYTFGVLIAISSTFFHQTDGQKIARVTLTGENRSEWVTWKNPQTDLEGAWLQSYEVIVEDLKGNELFHEYLYGDLVGLRAQVVTFHWPFHLLGFSNLCHLDNIYNGYRTANRHNRFPHLASALPFSFPFLQQLWTKLYHGQWSLLGIKSATLESAFLPLVSGDQPTQDTYWLLVGSSGLTSIPVNN